ncbi:MAG: tyrosine--tRNA ligase [Rickettsiales bacterium]
MSKSEFLNLMHERGYFNQCTDEAALAELADSGTLSGYIGFDVTAKSLHIGSLVQILKLRALQKCGHKPIILLGGGTTKIGDPSGKDEARQMLSLEDIAQNKKSIAKVFSKFLTIGEGKTDAMFVDNADWLDKINYIEFLRDYGKHFTINRMLTFDSVKLRLDREQPLTFLEFNYMLLQAYDFVELNRRFGCRLQMGGSDQWGNIVSGVDLGRRVGSEELFGLTSHLITTKSGAKMGKSAAGAIWLDADLLAPYDYWQFWRNTDDADVERFLTLFTELPIAEIKRLVAVGGQGINEAKVVLANEATTMCHGLEAAQHAEATARKVFAEGGAGGDLPVFELSRAELGDGIPAFKLFADSKMCESNGAARRLIQGKGARVNNVQIPDEKHVVTLSDFINGELKLSSGQKKHMMVKIA